MTVVKMTTDDLSICVTLAEIRVSAMFLNVFSIMSKNAGNISKYLFSFFCCFTMPVSDVKF